MTATGFDPILCPVDLSPISANALRHAVRLAACNEAKVVAVLVSWFEVPAYFTASRIESLHRQAHDSLSEARAVLGRFVETTLGAAAADVELVIEEGSPSLAILKLAAERNAGLIVMGTHGRTGINRWMLGSVAERVVRESPVPVLTARSAPVAEPGPVLAAVNDTELSRQLMSRAAGLAARCGRSLVVVHVRESNGEAPISDLCEWIPEAARSRCTVHELVRHGDPAEQIITAASEANASLLVIGASKRSFFQGSVLSRTALRVIRQAACPVLSIGSTATG